MSAVDYDKLAKELGGIEAAEPEPPPDIGPMFGPAALEAGQALEGGPNIEAPNFLMDPTNLIGGLGPRVAARLPILGLLGRGAGTAGSALTRLLGLPQFAGSAEQATLQGAKQGLQQSPMAQLAGRILARRVPGARTLEDVKDIAQTMRPAAAAEGIPQAATEVVPEGKVLVSEHLRNVPKRPLRPVKPKIPEASAKRIQLAKEAKPPANPQFSVKNPKTGKFELIEGKAKDLPASVQKRIAESSRLEQQYFSESQGKYIDIEGMHSGHLKSAFNKVGRQIAENKAKGVKAPVLEKVFETMKKEIAHRASTGGVTAY